jgi:hypothetical protein
MHRLLHLLEGNDRIGVLVMIDERHGLLIEIDDLVVCGLDLTMRCLQGNRGRCGSIRLLACEPASSPCSAVSRRV